MASSDTCFVCVVCTCLHMGSKHGRYEVQLSTYELRLMLDSKIMLLPGLGRPWWKTSHRPPTKDSGRLEMGRPVLQGYMHTAMCTAWRQQVS